MLTRIYFIGIVVYPRALLTSYNLRFTRQGSFFNHDASKLFNLKIQSSLVLETVNANKTRKVYLVIITSKELSIHVLVSLPLETTSMFMLKEKLCKEWCKECCKEKLFEKIRKSKITHKLPTLLKIVSCSKIRERN